MKLVENNLFSFYLAFVKVETTYQFDTTECHDLTGKSTKSDSLWVATFNPRDLICVVY